MEHLALGVAAADLADPVLDGRDAGRRPRVVPAREGVEALEERHRHLGQRAVPAFLPALAQALQLPLGGGPVPRRGQGHAHVHVVEEEQREVGAGRGARPDVPPAPRIGPIEEVQPPGERDRVVQVRGDVDGQRGEHAPEHALGVLVAPGGQVQERDVPGEVVPEVAEPTARLDARGQDLHAAVVVARLVQHVREGVDGPRVLGVQRDGAVGERPGLGEAPVLLEGEGVKPQDERVAVEGIHDRAGQRQHVRGAALPELEEEEPLGEQQLARPVLEDLGDEGARLRHPSRQHEVEGLDVLPLARGQRRRAGLRLADRRARLGRALVQEQRERVTGAREREVRIRFGGGAERRGGPGVEGQEAAHPGVVVVERGARRGGHGQSVEVGGHDGHPSSRAPRCRSPRRAAGGGSIRAAPAAPPRPLRRR